MVGVQAGSPVLIVGEIGQRLEGDLAMAGLSCAVAMNANDAVAAMKNTRFPVVVVPPVLVDMGGVDFIHGVLRHFDANVVLYGNGVETSEINALIRTGRVAHFPAHVDGHQIADFLARRNGGVQSPPTPAPSTPPSSARQAPPLTGAIPGFTPPGSSPPAPSFNLTPGPGSMPPSPGGMASLFGAPGAPGAAPLTSFPPVAASTFPATSFPPTAAFPTGSPGFVNTPSGGFPTAASAGFPSAGSAGFPSFPPAPSASIPRPPTIGPTPSGAGDAANAAQVQQLQAEARINQQRMEAMADDLARTNAELVSVRSQLATIEQERASLLVEVDAARRSAMAQVAEVMALSDEGDPISEEIEELRGKAASAEAELTRAWSETEALRAERDRLVAEAADRAGALADARSKVDAAEAALAELRTAGDAQKDQLETTKSELEMVRGELERLKAEAVAGRGEADNFRAERDSLTEELRAARAELEAAKGELSSAQALISEAQLGLEAARNEKASAESALQDEQRAREQMLQAKTELEAALGELEAAQEATEKRLAEESEKRKQAEAGLAAATTRTQQLETDLQQAETKSRSGSEVESALRIELERIKSDVGAARTDATTVRLDLQEALMRLDEASSAQQALAQERDALRAEAGPLRDWATEIVAEHAFQQAELERLREVLAAAEEKAKLVAELQALVHKLESERDSRPPAPAGAISGDVEVLLSRSRQIAELVRALEPFMYGLTQAAGFYTKQAVPGGEQHLRLLQQLQGVLLRLRDEIAMLDLG